MKKYLLILSVLLLVGCGHKISDVIPDNAYITISNEDELQSLLSNVSAKDYNGNDLEVYCSVNNGTKLMWNGKTRTSEIDFSKEGTYEIVYSTVGESNIYTREIATLHVK